MSGEEKDDPLQFAQIAMENAMRFAHGLHDSLVSYFTMLEQDRKDKEAYEKANQIKKT